ncbi:MAG: FAD-binding protein [Planctomycetes bacterium]|nr:FAD-binding protein [Planctomycetota bacterium]
MKTPEQIREELGSHLTGNCLTSLPVRVAYSTAACIYKIRPLAVILPKSAADVAATVRYGRQCGLPVIPRGAGTGLTGQVLGEGLILDFTRYMNQIEEVRSEANLLRVRPGAILGRVNEQLRSLGKRVPQDPASEAMCSIGGNVANNAGGLRAFKVGSTKHHVRGLEVVLSDGTVGWLRPVADGSPELAAMTNDSGTLGRTVRETLQVLRDNEPLIAEKRPLMDKSTAGYDLFSVFHDGLVDLTRLIVGSEGSLAVVTDVEIALSDLPPPPATAAVYFETMEQAGAAVQEILAFDPIAVEFMEKHFLGILRRERVLDATYLPDGIEAVLLVEFTRPTMDENRCVLRKMVARLTDELKLAVTWREAYDPAEQALLWKLRKAALPILNKLPPPRRIIPFIEDSVVPPERLAEYIHGLGDIFRRHGVEAAMYGHAGDANLHVRPILDLHTRDDVEKMRRMADEVTDLVLRMSGTLSGEHGDGRVRSAYLRRQFGPLYDVMRQIKRIWDPDGILAPENIVTDRAELDTEHLKYESPRRIATTGTRFDDAALREAIERCHGCGTCLAHCPSYKTTGDLWAGPRAKTNLLKAAMSGELDFAQIGLGDELRAAADLCYNCKTCLVECPSGVDTPALMLAEKTFRVERKGPTLADRMFAQAHLAGRLGSLTAPLSNRIAGWSIVRRLNRRLAGVADRPIPPFDRPSLDKYPLPSLPNPQHKVALFAGCFGLFNDPAGGRALVDVLAALGCEVVLPDQRCCGLPAYTSGMREAAMKDMKFNAAVLAPLVAAGYDIVSGCPSCVLSLKEDYPQALGDDAARTIAANVHDSNAYVARLLGERDDLPRSEHSFADMRLAYHAPCHLRALGQGLVPQQMLARAGEVRFALANTTCCGMGGTFGMKDRNHAISMKIAEELFARLKAERIEAVVTPCGMCKTQIETGTGLKVYHPMQVLVAIMR